MTDQEFWERCCIAAIGTLVDSRIKAGIGGKWAADVADVALMCRAQRLAEGFPTEGPK